MESLRAIAIRDLVTITLRGVPDRPGIAAEVFGALGEQGLNVEMVVSSGASNGRADISMAAARTERDQVRQAAERVRKQVGASGVETKDGSALVTLSGSDLAAQPGIAGRMFRALTSEGINIDAISTSLSSISCLIEDERAAGAVAVLNREFGIAT
jgi:aspartate kinase